MNNFVWADLSTYDLGKSKTFYENVFEWQFVDAGGYFVAQHGWTEVAGLFEPPEFFQKIGMPHFWMSYIAVENTTRIMELTKDFAGAKVELEDEFYGGKVALIRDPQGAGFTVYDGGRLDGRRPKQGHLMWNELHVSDASTVIPFYQRLFGWTVRPANAAGEHQILSSNDEHIADLRAISNEMKSKYEYWVITIAVEDLQQVRARVEENGGTVISDEDNRVMMHDNSGEAFFYVQLSV